MKMEQQQINYQFQPLYKPNFKLDQQQASDFKQRNQKNAQKRQVQIGKHFYVNFTPYPAYFNNNYNNINLCKQKPKFYSHSLLYDRQRLSLQRQSMYYRGAVDEFVEEGILKQFMQNDQLEKGSITKKGNKSVIIKDLMYYAHEQVIKAIQIPKVSAINNLQVYSQSIHPIQIVKFQKGNMILQIQQLKNSILNGVNLIIRFPRKMVVFNLDQTKITHTFTSQTQFLQLNSSVYKKSIFETLEYDGRRCILKQFQVSQQHITQRPKHEIIFSQLVNSCFNLSPNQLFLTTYKSMSIFDSRIGKQTQIHLNKNDLKQRFYSSIPLKGLYNYSPFIMSCQSRYLSILDIRKPQQFVTRILHNCEQSPPQVIQFYDGDSDSQLLNPVIACYSPYTLGSSMFTAINTQKLEYLSTQQKYSSSHYDKNYLHLFHDHGKSNICSNLHQIFNETISLYNTSDQQFQAFKVDNQGNLNMEIFAFNQFKEKYQARRFQPSQQNQFLLNKKDTNSGVQLWLEQNSKDKYFIQKNIYESNEKETNPLQTSSKGRKKGGKGKRAINIVKNPKKSTNKKQDLTELDDMELLDGQYQNQSECQQTFSKRKLNFTDLHKFYSALKLKTPQLSLRNHEKRYQKDISMNTTQANSQSSSFSQSLPEEFGTKTLSFHNKNLMSFSILQKMKNQWDN